LNNPLTLIDPTGELTEETLDNVWEDAYYILGGGILVIGGVAFKCNKCAQTGASEIYDSGKDALSEIWNDPDMADVKEGTEEFLGDVVDAAKDYASDFWDGTKEFVSEIME
jgi:hypothetical protein